MKKEQFKEIIEELNLHKFEWLQLNEIDSFVLSNGRGVYPNWKHLRFQILDDSIFVQHGDSVPYGGRLGNVFSISSDNRQIAFPPGSVLADTPYQFRLPRVGDIVCATDGHKKSPKFSAMIINIINASNQFVIQLSNPVIPSNDFRLSFYDPAEVEENICMHSTEVEGLYMKFSPNYGKPKKYGIKHEVIKIKDIKEIKLKLASQKIYTIKGVK